MPDTRETVRQVAERYFGTGLTEELLDDFKLIEVAGGDWLFHQGDDGRSLYLAVRGRLQVLTEDVDQSEPRLLGEVVPGESVGEVGLLTGEKRSAGIRAIRDSLLIRIDRQTFDDMSGKHPELVMKLAANVANMLRRTRSAATGPQFNTIALVPLGGADRVAQFSSDLCHSLDSYGQTLTLHADKLLDCGAPALPGNANSSIPDNLKHWLHQQETQNRFMVYVCEAGDNAWTQFAMRQSDLVVFIADSQQDPALADWESRLRTGKGRATGSKRWYCCNHRRNPGSTVPRSGCRTGNRIITSMSVKTGRMILNGWPGLFREMPLAWSCPAVRHAGLRILVSTRPCWSLVSALTGSAARVSVQFLAHPSHQTGIMRRPTRLPNTVL